MELDNYWEGMSAFLKLWVYDGATSYHLTVKRGTSTLDFYYSVT